MDCRWQRAAIAFARDELVPSLPMDGSLSPDDVTGRVKRSACSGPMRYPVELFDTHSCEPLFPTATTNLAWGPLIVDDRRSRERRRRDEPAPALGEHTRQIAMNLLGSHDKIDR